MQPYFTSLVQLYDTGSETFVHNEALRADVKAVDQAEVR